MTSRTRIASSKRSVVTLATLAASLVPAMAQIPMATEPFSRQQRTEVYGIGQYLHLDHLTFDGPTGDIKSKMDDTGLGGVGFAYHFNDFVSIHADFMFGNADFSADVPTLEGGTAHIRDDAFIQTGRFNIDYNIINRRLTPFVTAGIGWQYMETELESLPPIGTAWWDPWYGWVYYYDHPVAWETDFTWNAGAGFRWNILDNLFIKVTGGATWLSDDTGVVTQLEAIFSIGATF